MQARLLNEGMIHNNYQAFLYLINAFLVFTIYSHPSSFLVNPFSKTEHYPPFTRVSFFPFFNSDTVTEERYYHTLSEERLLLVVLGIETGFHHVLCFIKSVEE